MSIAHPNWQQSRRRDAFQSTLLASVMKGFVKGAISHEWAEQIDPVTEHANVVFIGRHLDQETFDQDAFKPIPSDQITLAIVPRVGVGPTMDP